MHRRQLECIGLSGRYVSMGSVRRDNETHLTVWRNFRNRLDRWIDVYAMPLLRSRFAHRLAILSSSQEHAVIQPVMDFRRRLYVPPVPVVRCWLREERTDACDGHIRRVVLATNTVDIRPLRAWAETAVFDPQAREIEGYISRAMDRLADRLDS